MIEKQTNAMTERWQADIQRSLREAQEKARQNPPVTKN